MKKYISVNVLLVFLVALLLTGCEDQKTVASTSAHEHADATKLAQILKQPVDYADKSIVVNGNFFPACTDSGCCDEFFLRDGISQIKVMKNAKMKIPELKNAQPIRVVGMVKATAQSPFIQATAIEVR